MLLRMTTVVGAVLAVAVAAFAQNVRRDGRWEIKMEMEMAGLPAGMPPVTSEHASRRKRRTIRTVSDYKVDGNKVTDSVKCDGQQPMSGTGEFIYAADSYTGVMTMEMGGRGTMKMKSTGKRFGDCTK